MSRGIPGYASGIINNCSIFYVSDSDTTEVFKMSHLAIAWNLYENANNYDTNTITIDTNTMLVRNVSSKQIFENTIHSLLNEYLLSNLSLNIL